MKIQNLSDHIQTLLLVVLGLLIISPFLWIVLMSLMPAKVILANEPRFLFTPTLVNYLGVLGLEQILERTGTASTEFLMYFKNSVIMSVGTLLLSHIVGVPIAYLLARYDFPGKEDIAFTFLSLLFFPAMAIMIPLYLVFTEIGLYGTHIGSILGLQLIGIPFVVWIMRGYFEAIPMPVVEAAVLDGCNWLEVLFRIYIPMSIPGLSVSAIMVFIFSWNNLLIPLTLSSGATTPITVGAINFIQYDQVLWGQMAAASVLTIIPVVIFAMLIRDRITQGLSLGMIKQ